MSDARCGAIIAPLHARPLPFPSPASSHLARRILRFPDSSHRHGPREEEKRGRGGSGPTNETEPALGWSIVVNLEGLDKVLPVIAADSNEWKATKI